MNRPLAGGVTVAILGDDAVIGQALAHLLEASGYGARFLREPAPERWDEALHDVEVVLLAPGLSVERRQALLSGVRSTPSTRTVPVLELPSVNAVPAPAGIHQVRWPCRLAELARQIEAARANAPRRTEDPTS